MDAEKKVPEVTVGGVVESVVESIVESVADTAGGGGPSSSSAAPLTSNPQAAIPEGLNTAKAIALPTLPTLPTRPTLSAAPSSVPSPVAPPPRISTKGHTGPSLLRGPVPQKGSGQDRFRQLLENTNENNPPRLITAAQSSPFAVPTGTLLRPMAAPRYSPGVTSVDPPPFTLCPVTPARPDSQDSGRATASNVTTEMLPAIKAESKDTPLTKQLKQPKLTNEVARGHKTPSSGGDIRYHPLATARLSAQCQLRHFNPKWHEKSGPKGFTCSVQLVDKFIRTDRAYKTAYDAKQAAAEKALVYVCKLPCSDPSRSVATRIRTSGQTHRIHERHRAGRAPVKREPSAGASRAPFHDAYTYAAPARANAPYNWNAFNYNQEQSALLHRIQSAFGGAGPSPHVLADPLAAQAFLQGLAVGTSVRAASSAYNPYVEPRGHLYPSVTGDVYRPYEARERSPAPNSNSDRNYRDRSSPRRRTSLEPSSRRPN
ncbi:hypothetical protein HD806DRAFT_526219 [Xylariaceae sp. AK1471]|nr:hypothetical protein HD806DRAFT_526219 [Xylariaceae sp. AK1471]